MAAQITVIDPSARRYVMKIPPSKYLSEVRDEACEKFRLDPGKYGLKNNSKQVDLTRTYRLSGLASGAKLELVQLSRSPSAVSVALRLPESEVQSGENPRLTAKFSSATSLWQILRAFESGKAGETGKVKNFTAKGVPVSNGSSGRLCHEFPVLNIMGKDHVTFVELQKTLAQLGYNDGNVMIRLSFRTTQTPLEEAMASIDQYFKSLETEPSAGASSGTEHQSSSVLVSNQPAQVESETSAQVPSSPDPPNIREAGNETSPNQFSSSDTNGTRQQTSEAPPLADAEEGMKNFQDSHLAGAIPSQQSDEGTEGVTAESSTASSLTKPGLPIPLSTSTEPAPIPGITSRPVTIFKAPSTQTPQAATEAYRESDYEPTIDSLKKHQGSIIATTRNKRLPTDAEMAEKEAVKAQKLASVQSISIKVVFPDEFKVVARFSTSDTARNLYAHVREFLSQPSQPFSLTYTSLQRVATPILEGDEKLIKDLQLTGPTLVSVVGIPDVTQNARKDLSTKNEARQQAKEMEVKPLMNTQPDDENKPTRPDRGEGSSSGKSKSGSGGKPKWFKMGRN